MQCASTARKHAVLVAGTNGVHLRRARWKLGAKLAGWWLNSFMLKNVFFHFEPEPQPMDYLGKAGELGVSFG